MERRIGIKRLMLVLLIVFSVGAPMSAFAAPWTPVEWQNQGKWRGWIRDRNGNFVDDLIEGKSGKVDVIVDFNGCIGDPSTSGIVKYLNTLGDVTYVGKYVTFAIVKGVAVKQTFAIAKRPEVAMVELARTGKWLGDNYKAAKIETSTDYQPNTLQNAFGWPGTLSGQGIGIAFLDTGVGPTFDQYYTHGYDALTNTETNPSPDPNVDHATWMASWVFGPGGLAPQASLIDIKVGTASGPDPTALAKALDKVYEKKKSWGINVVSLMFSLGMSDGMDAISQQVNLLASSGIVVVAAAGDNSPNTPVQSPGAASRAVAITAADIKGTVNRGDDTATYVKGPRPGPSSLDALKPELAMPTAQDDTAVSNSIATAEAAGLAALVLQQNAGLRDFDNSASGSVKDLLIRTAESKGTANTTTSFPNSSPSWNEFWGFGEVDAFSAFQHLTGQAPAGRTDLTFKGFDDSPHPSSPWYYSHAVRTQSEQQGKNIVAGVPDKIFARVYNNGSESASNVRVNFAFYEFTAGIPKFHDIGSVVIPVITATKDAVASIDWTPPKLPPGMEHGCILVTIDYGYDTAFTNMSNVAQKNVQVKSASSPAVFTFHVENPLPENARIDLKVSTEQGDWSIRLSDSSFFVAPGDCPKTVKATVEPPAHAKYGAEALFFVTAVATPRGKEQGIEIGGVALRARYEPRKRPPGGAPPARKPEHQ